jgi:hypothetical protein
MTRDMFVTCREDARLVLRPLPLSFVALALCVLAVVPKLAQGDSSTEARRRDVASVFFVAKSENRNQVHYGVHLDSSCAPAGASPAFAYWRMLEVGPLATEPLLSREVRAYGFADQRILSHEGGAGRVAVTLQSLPDRPILIASTAAGETCLASATTNIAGAPAFLSSVYVKLSWPFGVESLTLSGRALADGRELHERVRP